jgi:hypothetical protein
MEDADILWDLEDDLDGNVQHIAEHDLTCEEVESVLRNTDNTTEKSRTSGLRRPSAGRTQVDTLSSCGIQCWPIH